MGTGSISLIFVFIILNLWQISNKAYQTVTGLFKLPSAKPQAENVSVIIKQVQGIEELTTTIYTMETIVPTSADRKWGDFSVATTRLLYIGRGEVRAGIDLSKLTEQDIKIKNNIIQINLPSPQILDSKIDVSSSRVYDYDRGFLNLGPDVAPQLQILAQRKSLEQILDNACRDGILDTANQKAQESIVQLLVNTSEKSIKINTQSPVFSDCN
ncbi:MAG: hypothetical protein Tsb0014_34830 [Pleurocapsa sp.]